MTDLSHLRNLRQTAFAADPRELCDELVRFEPEFGETAIFQEVLGIANFRLGEPDAGVKMLSKAASNLEHECDQRSLLILMRTLFSAEKWDAAFELSQRMLARDPDSEAALRVAARIHTLRGENEAAEQAWRRLCDNFPQSVEAALQVTRFAQRREDWETQSHYADIALSADPNNLDALRLAVQARMRSRSYDRLPALLPQLYTFEPERVRSYLRTAGLLDQSDALAAAFAAVRATALEDEILAAMSAERAHLWLNAGRHAVKEGNIAKAGCCFRSVLRIEPD